MKVNKKRKASYAAAPGKKGLSAESNILREPVAHLSPDTRKASQIFINYLSAFESPARKLDTIKKGLSSASIRDLGDMFGYNQADIAQLLSITEPTLRKYIKEEKHLDSGKSELIIELFELVKKGIDTFGSLEEFKKWIHSPNVLFKEAPARMLDTITGIHMVRNGLLRLDHGVLA